MRLTVGQALVRFLANQYSERDGVEQRLIAGCFGIFGHGNVAGVGQALLEAGDDMPYVLARNEQAMVHAASGYARQKNRLSTYACTASVGPGSTNMVTGAALATINRLPVLLLPGDIFATRVANPVLQELEDPTSLDISVNDTFKPVSRFWDRINRPEQLISSALAAMRVLTDPAETGAVTLALPQDVQAEAYDWPEEFFATPRLARAPPAGRGRRARRGRRAAARRPPPADRHRRRHDLRRGDRRAARARRGHRHPGRRDAGRQGLAALRPPAVARRDRRHRHDRRQRDRPRGRRDPRRRHALERLHHRLALAVRRGRALHQPQRGERRRLQARRAAAGRRRARRAARRCAARSRAGAPTPTTPSARRRLAAEWDATVEQAYTLGHGPLPAQSEVLGVVNRVSGPRDVVVCAAGSMPGDLHKLWRTRDPKGYHVEYGYSCMGYEIAGGLGVKLAAPDRDVYVMVGDGSFLMMAQEIVTAVQEGVEAQDRARPEPRLRVDRRAVASRSARSASARSTARTRTSPRWRRASARPCVRATTLDELEAGPARRHRRHRRPDRDRPARRRARTPRRGGTCRWPRSPASTPRAPRARPTTRTSRPSSST